KGARDAGEGEAVIDRRVRVNVDFVVVVDEPSMDRRAKDCGGHRKHSHRDNPHPPGTIGSETAFRFRHARTLAGQAQSSRRDFRSENETALRDDTRQRLWAWLLLLGDYFSAELLLIDWLQAGSAFLSNTSAAEL